MPYIGVKTTQELSHEQKDQLKSAFAEKLPLIPGKTEKALMVDFSDGHTMYLGGEERDLAFLDVRCYGTTEFAHKKAFTEAIFDVLQKQLGLAENAIYLCYGEYPVWGTLGSMK